MTNQRMQPPARPTPGGAAPTKLRGTGTVTSKDGTTIAYEATGSGPPLIVVMGALGTKDVSFSRQYAAELSRHFTAILYDRRGRGGSTDVQPYAVQREVEDLDALVQAAGGAPYVFGISSGAALALDAAASGVPMAGLCVYEPPYMVGNPKNRPDADFEEKLRRMAAEGRRDDAVRYFMRTVGVPAPIVWVMSLLPKWKQVRAVAHTLPYDAAVMAGFAFPAARLRSVRVRTLAATGTKSPPNLREAVQQVAATVPGAALRVLPKQNHGVKPKAIGPALAEFFLGTR